jgi:hypothetical protein
MSTEKFLRIQKNELIDELLDPVSKVTDVSSFIINNEGITAICSNDANIILFVKYSNTKIDEAEKLNIYDIKRFIRLLDVIESDVIDLTLTSNTLSYKSPKLKFKYHLAEDAMVPITKISVNKILALSFNCKFLVSKIKVQELLKGSSVITDSNKVYFTASKDGGVVADLTDMQSPQTDSVAISIADEFEGESLNTPLPINLDVFRLMSSIKYDFVLIKVNTDLKVLMFELVVGNTALKYIVSSLVK